MNKRSRLSVLALTLMSSIAMLVTVAGAPANALGDRDCSDFANQRQAQLYFLQHGGPRSDPDALDADGDGVACESNPCPCYDKRTPPGGGTGTPPRETRSAVRLAVSRSRAIAGETIRLKARVLPGVIRDVILQRSRRGAWHSVDRAWTTSEGRFTFTQRAGKASSSFRAIVKATQIRNKRYTAATSPVRTVRTVGQSVDLTLRKRTVVGREVVARVHAAPTRFRRPVVLQVRSDGSWVTVGTDRESRRGRASITFLPDQRGRFTYRAVVKRFHGAAPKGSNKERLRVRPAADTTAPPVPAGLNATAGDGSVDLAWTAVSASDLAGYNVYQAATETGTYTKINTALVTSASYPVTGLTNGTTYWFAVTAVDDSGNESVKSTPDSATPVADPPPATPQSLNATAGDGSVHLTWDAVSDSDLAGYNVYQSETETGTYTKVNTSLVTPESYDVTGLTNGTTYWFKVTAVDDGSHESAQSAAASATPAAGP